MFLTLHTSRSDSGFLARVAGTCSKIDKLLETSITLNITEHVSQRDKRHRKAAVLWHVIKMFTEAKHARLLIDSPATIPGRTRTRFLSESRLALC